MLAAHVSTGRLLDNCPVRVPPSILDMASGDGRVLIRDLLAFYFAHVIAGVRHFIRAESPWRDFNFAPGNTDDHLIFQMAVPAGLLASHGKTEEAFREALILGHELSGHADALKLKKAAPCRRLVRACRGSAPIIGSGNTQALRLAMPYLPGSGGGRADNLPLKQRTRRALHHHGCWCWHGGHQCFPQKYRPASGCARGHTSSAAAQLLRGLGRAAGCS